MNILHLQRAVMRCPSFNAAQTLTLIALTNVLDWGTWSGAVSFKYLAYEAGVSYGAVRRALDHFIDLGLMTKQAQSNSRGHDRNQYSINISALNELIAEYVPKNSALIPPPAQKEHSPAQKEHSPAQKEHSPAQKEHPLQPLLSTTIIQPPKPRLTADNPFGFLTAEEQLENDKYIQQQNNIITAHKKAERDRARNWRKRK